MEEGATQDLLSLVKVFCEKLPLNLVFSCLRDKNVESFYNRYLSCGRIAMFIHNSNFLNNINKQHQHTLLYTFVKYLNNASLTNHLDQNFKCIDLI